MFANVFIYILFRIVYYIHPFNQLPYNLLYLIDATISYLTYIFCHINNCLFSQPQHDFYNK